MINDRKSVGEGGEEAWLGILQNRPKEKPFFFWFAAFDAHRPWSALDSMSGNEDPQPHDPGKGVRVPPQLLDTPATRTDLAGYYNEIGRLDRYLGDLQRELERQGIADYVQEVEKLRKVLRQWQDETGDTAPEVLTPDWYLRETGKPLPAQKQSLRGEMPGAAKGADRVMTRGPF